MHAVWLGLLLCAGAGAVPVPDDAADDAAAKPVTLDEVDTSVSIDDVRGVTGRWPVRERMEMKAPVMLALYGSDDDQQLHLMIVEHHEGDRRDVALGPAVPEAFGHTFDGNTYLSRQTDYTGPIVFAVRVAKPGGGARRQVVVYSVGSSLRVVERTLGGKAWTPRLRIDFGRGTTFEGIGTTDPH